MSTSAVINVAAPHGLSRLAGRARALGRAPVCGPIGLEVAAERLHMVQFDDGEPPRRVRAAVSVPFPGSRDELLADRGRFRKLVRFARARAAFHGSRVVSCLPQGELRILTLNYRKGAGQSDADAIVAELRERLKSELDEAIVDFMPIRGDRAETSERSAIVAVAQRARVMAYLALLEHAGLEPEALDIGPAALARLIGNLGDGTRFANALLINFGQARSYVSLIWGRRLMLDRDVAFCEQRLAGRLSQVLRMSEHDILRLLLSNGFRACDPADALAAEIAGAIADISRPEIATLVTEINKTLIYAASRTHGQTVEQVYLMGSVARYPGIAEHLQSLISVPVAVVNPFSVFPAASAVAKEEALDPIAGIGLATGLALRSINGHG